jgi:hypothetical protein
VTRREHAQELRTYLQLAPFGLSDFRALVRELKTSWPSRPTRACCWPVRRWRAAAERRILPALSVIDRACSEAIARANRRVYRALIEPLTDRIGPSSTSCSSSRPAAAARRLTWLRQSPLKPNSRHMLEHIERLKTFQLVDLPEASAGTSTRTACSSRARVGRMTPKDLGKFEPQALTTPGRRGAGEHRDRDR